MGIGRKATDQRTPCRKFLTTPLLLQPLQELCMLQCIEKWQKSSAIHGYYYSFMVCIKWMYNHLPRTQTSVVWTEKFRLLQAHTMKHLRSTVYNIGLNIFKSNLKSIFSDSNDGHSAPMLSPTRRLQLLQVSVWLNYLQVCRPKTEMSMGMVDPRVGSGRVGSGRIENSRNLFFVCWIFFENYIRVEKQFFLEIAFVFTRKHVLYYFVVQYACMYF